MAATQIKEMRPTHDGILDVVLEHPHATLSEIGRLTGYSVSWLSILMRSDCFRAEYDRRRGEIEAECMAGIQERLASIAHLAIDKMEEQLKKTNDSDFIVDAFDKVLHRAGYAPTAKTPAPATPLQINNFIVTKEELATLRGEIVNGSSTPIEEAKLLPNEPAPA